MKGLSVFSLAPRSGRGCLREAKAGEGLRRAKGQPLIRLAFAALLLATFSPLCGEKERGYLIACGLIGLPVPPVMISGGPQKENSYTLSLAQSSASTFD